MQLLLPLLPLLLTAGQPRSSGIVSLDGVWNISLVGDGDHAASWSADVDGQSTVVVPGSWDAQGHGPATDRLRSNWLGRAIYSKRVAVPPVRAGASVWLVVERPKRAVQVRVDSIDVGDHIGYLTDFEADVSAQLKNKNSVTLELEVDAVWGQDNVPPLGTCPFSFGQGCSPAAGKAQKGAPSPTDQMVGSNDLILPWGAPGDWGGIYGHVYFAVRERLSIANVLVVTPGSPPNGTVQMQVELAPGSRPPLPGDNCHVQVVEAENGQTAATADAPVTASGCATSATVPNPRLWWPHAPRMYTLVVTIHEKDSSEVLCAHNESFGFRNLSVSGKHFLLNNEPIFLAGYGDDNIFPLTYAPTFDREWYRRKFEFARSVGFLFVRYHSHVLPDECYEEADRAGVMLQSASPIGYSSAWNLPPGGYGTAAGHALVERSFNHSLIRLRNHPSHVAFSFGNGKPSDVASVFLACLLGVMHANILRFCNCSCCCCRGKSCTYFKCRCSVPVGQSVSSSLAVHRY